MLLEGRVWFNMEGEAEIIGFGNGFGSGSGTGDGLDDETGFGTGTSPGLGFFNGSGDCVNGDFKIESCMNSAGNIGCYGYGNGHADDGHDHWYDYYGDDS